MTGTNYGEYAKTVFNLSDAMNDGSRQEMSGIDVFPRAGRRRSALVYMRSDF